MSSVKVSSVHTGHFVISGGLAQLLQMGAGIQSGVGMSARGVCCCFRRGHARVAGLCCGRIVTSGETCLVVWLQHLLSRALQSTELVAFVHATTTAAATAKGVFGGKGFAESVGGTATATMLFGRVAVGRLHGLVETWWHHRNTRCDSSRAALPQAVDMRRVHVSVLASHGYVGIGGGFGTQQVELFAVVASVRDGACNVNGMGWRELFARQTCSHFIDKKQSHAKTVFNTIPIFLNNNVLTIESQRK